MATGSTITCVVREYQVLHAIRTGQCEVDFEVRSGIYGTTLEGAIVKIANDAGIPEEHIRLHVHSLLTRGLIKYAENRLRVHHKAGRGGAYCRSRARKGKALRTRVIGENLVRESIIVDPVWDPVKLTKEEKKYRRWVKKVNKKAWRPTSPAGGWDYTNLKKFTRKTRKREEKALRASEIQELQDLVNKPFDEGLLKEEAAPCGLVPDLLELVDA